MEIILKESVVYSIAKSIIRQQQYVSPLDSSSLDDAASMAGFAQITAERAGG